MSDGTADRWTSGERTVESFLSRIESRFENGEVACLREVADFADERGYVDTRRGSSNANLSAKADAVNPEVGCFDIRDNRSRFRWGWLNNHTENNITLGDIQPFVENLDDIGPMSVTYNRDVPKIEDIPFEASSDNKLQRLQKVLQEFDNSCEVMTDA